MPEKSKRIDKNTSRPSSHWWLISAFIVAALGALIAIVESAQPEGHHSMFGLALLWLAGFVFSVGVLVELFSIGSAVRRIETHIKTPAKPTGDDLIPNPPGGSTSQPKSQTVS